MTLFELDFWSLVLLFAGLVVIGIGYRVVGALADFSERTIARMAQTGMSSMARALLALLIGYDAQTYQKSRFLIWNQVRTRFLLLWAGFGFLVATLMLLKVGRTVDSVGEPLFYLLGATLLIRLVVVATRPSKTTSTPHINSLIHDVNEQSEFTQYRGRQVIRRWDYLDELFANPV